MAKARCRRCLGIASGETFEIAKRNIDHAIGLRTGRPCGANQEHIEEIFDESAPKIISIPKVVTEHQKIILDEKPKIIEPEKIKEKPKIIEPRAVKKKPKIQTKSVKIQSK